MRKRVRSIALLTFNGFMNWRVCRANSSSSFTVSRHRWAVISELRDDAEPSLDQMLAKLDPCDLVIVEGYKRDGHDKIEVRNLDNTNPKLSDEDETIVAVAANGGVTDCPVPVYDRDNIFALADFICGRTGLVEVP